MSEGFVPDNTYGKKLQSRWVAGAPEESFWSGIKVRGDVPIVTWRCPKCGLLKSYAVPD
jgi:hypothetical protein